MANNQTLLTPEEFATKAKIHKLTVLRWIRKGQIKAMSNGVGPATRYLIKVSELQKLKTILPFLKSDARYTKN